MAIILNIETATPVCGIALAENEVLLSERKSKINNSHAASLTVFIEEVFNETKLKPDAIAVSAGPGSYTGLRIGLSVAKGLCYGYGIPLIMIPTHAAMATEAIARYGHNCLYAPMLDAGRMEVYLALYASDLQELVSPKAEILSDDTLKDFLSDTNIVVFGSGSQKFVDGFSLPKSFVHYDTFEMSAINMIPVANDYYKREAFADLALSEPLYLKDFIPGTPNVKGLR